MNSSVVISSLLMPRNEWSSTVNIMDVAAEIILEVATKKSGRSATCLLRGGSVNRQIVTTMNPAEMQSGYGLANVYASNSPMCGRMLRGENAPLAYWNAALQAFHTSGMDSELTMTADSS